MAERRKQPSIECNNALVEMLLEIGDYEKNVNRSVVKYNAYRKAANAIAKLEKPVKSGKDAEKLPGIGKKIGEKIDQFLQKGSIDKLAKIRGDDRTEATAELMRVSGIGPAHAAKLIERGVDNIDKLRKHPGELTHHQKIGLKYVDDFEKRVPREEIAKFEKILKAAAKSVNSKLTVTVCGSYRRGALTSGDVDALVTESGLTSADGKYKHKAGKLLSKLVGELTERGVVTDTISHGDTKFMGVALLPRMRRSTENSIAGTVPSGSEERTDSTISSDAPPEKRKRRNSDTDTSTTEEATTSESSASASENVIHRRLDIKMSPSDQYPFGTLHFTGSDEFNRQMRAKSLEAGFTLNEYCIRPVGVTLQPGEPVPMDCERDIFEIIGMDYVPPEKRSW